jgi:hypothetical protein
MKHAKSIAIRTLVFFLILVSFFFKGYTQGFTYTGGTTGTTSGGSILVDAASVAGVYVGHGLYKYPNNIAVGDTYTLNSTTTGIYNCAFGTNALKSTTTGSNNIAFGHGVLQQNTIGSSNTAIGHESLQLLGQVTGANYYNNTALGFQSGKSLKSGVYNLFLGSDCASYGSFNGNDNTGVGALALKTLAEGSTNVAIGRSALENLQYGSNNVAIGDHAYVDGVGTSTSPVSNWLSIQNVIYGKTMNSTTNATLGIGLKPTGTTTGLMPAGTLSKLHIGGTTTIPSLQLDVVPNAAASSGRKFLFVDDAGIVQQSTVIPGTSFCGTANYLTKATDASGGTGCSQVYDNGTNVGIAVGTSPTAKLDIDCANGASLGTIRIRNLQINDGTSKRPLLIDDNGYLYKASVSYDGRSSIESGNIDPRIEKLESEVKALKEMLELLMKNQATTTSAKLFAVYPNPASGQLHITKSTAQPSNVYYVELRDLQNQVVMNKRVVNQSADLRLDSRLAAGNYMLVFYDNEKLIQSEMIAVVK